MKWQAVLILPKPGESLEVGYDCGRWTFVRFLADYALVAFPLVYFRGVRQNGIPPCIGDLEDSCAEEIVEQWVPELLFSSVCVNLRRSIPPDNGGETLCFSE